MENETLHTCKHENDLAMIAANVKTICAQVKDIHEEIKGPPGQPGLKSKVESQGKQLATQWAVLSFIGISLVGGFIKIIFF